MLIINEESFDENISFMIVVMMGFLWSIISMIVIGAISGSAFLGFSCGLLLSLLFFFDGFIWYKIVKKIDLFL